MPRVDRALLRTRGGRTAATAVALLAVAVAATMAVLWPSGAGPDEIARLLQPGREHAQVVDVRERPCLNTRFRDCRTVTVRILTGARRGETIAFRTGDEGFVPRYGAGTEVTLLHAPGRVREAGPSGGPLRLGEPRRGTPLALLAAAFALLAILVGRRRGAWALAGLTAGLAVVFVYVLPAILGGEAPALVALSGGLAVMLAGTLLAHGITAKSLAAIVGTAAALALTTALALLMLEAAHLTGFVGDDAGLLRYATSSELSLSGLLLAGILISTLGVLDDVTISQASAVLALRRADPRLGAHALYDRALEVGRDHVSAAVNTLVLAYVGAALPVLLVFSVGGVPVLDALDREDVAGEVVAMLVGSIGLMAAVPLATAAAAALATRIPPGAAGDEHVHVH